MSQSMQISVGDINERGYLNGMTRRGFTPAKGNLELVANTLDSHDSAGLYEERTLLYNVQQDTVEMIDDAGGMNEQDIRNAFSMHRENHIHDMSRGVSGMGGKNSMFILSQKKNMRLYTKKEDGGFYKIEVPWTDIIREGVYTSKILSIPMNDTEKELFMKQRHLNGMCHNQNVHGTTIEFPNNNELVELIEANFKPIQDTELTNPLDRISIVFGRENIKFAYKTAQSPEVKILEKYNYFSLPNTSYYQGVSSYTIEQWTKGEEHRFRLLHEDSIYEINKAGKGWKKLPELASENPSGYQHVGNYTVKVGLRIDPEYFNPASPPVEPKNSSELYGIDKKFLGKDEFDYLAQYKLFRNNMLIGLIPSPDIAISSSRANAKADLEYCRTQVEVSFCPTSTQGNAMDRAMNIQENKNQFDGKTISLKFTRLLKWLRQEKATEIWNYFTNVIRQHNVVVQPIVEEDADDEGSTISDASSVSVHPTNPNVLNQLQVAHVQPLPESDSDTETESTLSADSHRSVVVPTPTPSIPRQTRITIDIGSLDTRYQEFMENLQELCRHYDVTLT